MKQTHKNNLHQIKVQYESYLVGLGCKLAFDVKKTTQDYVGGSYMMSLRCRTQAANLQQLKC